MVGPGRPSGAAIGCFPELIIESVSVLTRLYLGDFSFRENTLEVTICIFCLKKCALALFKPIGQGGYPVVCFGKCIQFGGE